MIQKSFKDYVIKSHPLALMVGLYLPFYLAMRGGLLDGPLNWIYIHIPLWAAIADIMLGSVALCVLIDLQKESRASFLFVLAILVSITFLSPSLRRVDASNGGGIWLGFFILSVFYTVVRYIIRSIRGRKQKEIQNDSQGTDAKGEHL